MDEIKLSLSQTGPTRELSIIRVDGVVDTITASELENVIERLISQSKFKILVDLGGVEYISSAGWGIFISRIQEIRDNEGDIKLVNMIPNVREIYELLEFENIIPSFESLDLGRKAFNIPISGDGDQADNGNRVWKAEDNIVAERGNTIQTAMSPGTKNGRVEAFSSVSGLGRPNSTQSSYEIILNLIAEDPFASISELAEDVAEVAPHLKLGWWSVFGILRRNGLLTRRARFRLARKRSRR